MCPEYALIECLRDWVLNIARLHRKLVQLIVCRPYIISSDPADEELVLDLDKVFCGEDRFHVGVEDGVFCVRGHSVLVQILHALRMPVGYQGPIGNRSEHLHTTRKRLPGAAANGDLIQQARFEGQGGQQERRQINCQSHTPSTFLDLIDLQLLRWAGHKSRVTATVVERRRFGLLHLYWLED